MKRPPAVWLAIAALALGAIPLVLLAYFSIHLASNAVRHEVVRRVAATDPETRAVEEEFRRALGTKVVLTRVKNGGRLTIEFYSNEELEALRRRLTAR